jgi:MoaA/NifB/PqqE/SkfB family radical SAM enzyme
MTASLPELTDHIVSASPGASVHDLQLDGTKIYWYPEHIRKWQRGERVPPITMDVAWTRKCSAACNFCYASLQSSDGGVITKEIAFQFLEDAAEIGVKGVSLISDGESTEVPFFAESIQYGASLGLQMGTSSNGIKLTPAVLEQILPSLCYLRFNFSGGERHRWAQIMGVKQALYDRVVSHIKAAVEIKQRDNLPVSLNMQLVSMPQDADQLLPFARLAKEVFGTSEGYAIIKHCADSRDGELGVDYSKYADMFETLRQCESLGEGAFRVAVKWSRLQDEGKRSYQRCYGPPHILQMSGNGLIAPCGQLFNSRYAKMHIGNICITRFRDIYHSDRYKEVLDYIASEDFNAQISCGPNCLQHNSNVYLDRLMKGDITLPNLAGMTPPPHLGFL